MRSLEPEERKISVFPKRMMPKEIPRLRLGMTGSAGSKTVVISEPKARKLPRASIAFLAGNI
jgi:hypothetical protein